MASPKNTTFTATTPCPLCRATVSGIDPMRTCAACQAQGAPVRVAWELAKPVDSALSGVIVIEAAK